MNWLSAKDFRAILAGIVITVGVLLPKSAVAVTQTIEQLSADWWHWALSFPAAASPLTDTTGVYCSLGQQPGLPWFLSGTWIWSGGTRTCSVPKDTLLFVPVYSYVNFDSPNVCGLGPDQQTVAKLRADAAADVDGAMSISVFLDGQSIGPVPRAQSELFVATLPADNVFDGPCFPLDVPGSDYSPAIADGYYALINPLAVGTHTLRIYAEHVGIGPVVDLTYLLTVEGHTLQLGAAAYSVGEGAGSLTIPVTRLGTTTDTVSVNYATANGTATAGQDYSSTAGTLTFLPGIGTMNIVVPILEDSDMEGTETFTVTLSNPSGVDLGVPSIGTVTIIDNDLPGFTLLIATAGTGTGVVTSNPAGISCGTTCSANFSDVSLFATPSAGSVLAGWSGSCAGLGVCTLSLLSPLQATATFGLISFATADANAWVQKAYMSYYGRPADPGGVEYWANRMDAEGGSLSTIIAAFGNSDEFNRRYGGLSYAALVTKIYQQALGRDPEPAGLAYYVGELQAGHRTLQTITLDVLLGATGMDALTVANRVDVANHFTGKVAAGCPYPDELTGVNSLASVTSDSTSVFAAKSAIESRCGP